jgi:acyl transferase domain-containing protein
MACRFPGAPGLDEFWQLLRDGRDKTTEIPADRFDGDSIASPPIGVDRRSDLYPSGEHVEVQP